MSPFSEEKGYTLVEVVAAMALLLVVFMVSIQLVMNTVTQSVTIEEDFSSIEIADSILDYYQSQPVEDIKGQLNSTVSVDIAGILEVPSDEVEGLRAEISFSEPDSIKLRDQLIKLKVVIESVESNRQQAELEGYVEL